MKIAMLDPSFFTLPYDHCLCQALVHEGCNIALIGTQAEEDPNSRDYDQYELYYGLTNRLFPRNGKNSLRLAFKGTEHIVNSYKVLRFLQEWQPDIIHFQWLPIPLIDGLLVKAMKSKAKLVFTVHDTNLFNGVMSSRMQAWGYTKLMQTFDRLIVHTEYSKQEILKADWVPESRISVVPHGIFENYKSDLSRSRQGDDNSILAFGTIKAYKGIDILLRAVAKLPPELLASTKVVVAGNPPSAAEPLKQLARELRIEDYVRWDLRYIPDSEVDTLFSSSSIVALPYRTIDQSGVLMTALAFHKPVVASRIGGFPETIQHGIHGYLVEPDNVDALANALVTMLSDAEGLKQMSVKIEQLISGRYAWSKIAEETKNVYKELLDRGC